MTDEEIELLEELAKVEAAILQNGEDNLISFLYPEEDIQLTPGEFPSTHKIFEDSSKISSRHLYPKHLEFWSKGKDYHQRLFRAGNRVGKTLAGCMEVVFHLTGLYPVWWEGKRFTTNNDWWVAGVSSETVTKILQPYFLGPVGKFGTGLIPKHCIDFESLTDARKATTTVGTVRIRHKNGNYSSLSFKSYEQGQDSFQGVACSIFLDEEPGNIAVYRESLMRTMTGGNILLMTFTPLKGNSEVIQSWFPHGDVTASGDMGDGKWVSSAGMDDVKHLSPEKVEMILKSYPPFQRTARRFGLPTLEQGAIFPIEESNYVIEPFEIPKHWPKAYGFDVGRNTGATWIALDRDSGTIYTYSEMFISEGLPSTHAQGIQARGKWVKGAIDTASRGRSPTDGQNLYQQYIDLGLNIQNADKAVESGLYEMLELLSSGRLKVFNTCQFLLKEIRGYRRDDKGQIIKKNDHLCDAWRYAIFTRDRILQTEAEYEARNKPVDLFDNSFNSSPDSWMLR